MLVKGMSGPIGSQFKLVLSVIICIWCFSGVTEYTAVVVCPGFLERAMQGGEGKTAQVQ